MDDSEYALNLNYNLPENAWVSFLIARDTKTVNSTKLDFGPFRLKEQQRLLLIGACLQCH